MRLIDADEVIETLLTTDDVESIFLDLAQNRRLDYLHDVEESDVVDFARDIIKAAIGVINTSPTIDAEPVRHAHWIKNDDADYSCSECGFRFTSGDDISEFKFCRCGAKMDEVRRNDFRRSNTALRRKSGTTMR